MKININNKKFIKIILILHTSYLSSLFLQEMIAEACILRALLGLVIILIPGVIILKLLDIKTSLINWGLYTIGLSIVFMEIIGLLIGLIYPLIGISHPFSTINLIIMIFAANLFLCFIISRKNYPFIEFSFNFINYLLPYKLILFPLFLTILSVIGSYTVRYYDFNILLLFLLAIIAFIPIFILIYNTNQEYLYPFLLFTISLSLLYHNLLSIPAFRGWDIYIEYYYANIINTTSYWNLHDSSSYVNSFLGSVLLPSMLSKIMGIELTQIYKLIYPLIASITPVAVYQASKNLFGSNIAFLSSFLYISYFYYYEGLLSHVKDIMAITFMSLLILLISENNISIIKIRYLSFFFSFGLITSHYGFPYIFLLMLCSLFFIFLINSKIKIIYIEKPKLARANFILCYVLITICWYLYTSRALGFREIIHDLSYVINNIGKLFSPIQGGSIYYLTKDIQTIDYKILKFLYIIIMFFTLFGCIKVILMAKRCDLKMNEYILSSLLFFGWLSMSVFAPFLTGGSSFELTRMYNLALLFLAPLCILGGKEILKLIRLPDNKQMIVLAAFLAIFLLFNSKFVGVFCQEIIGGDQWSISISLSQPIIKRNPTEKALLMYYGAVNSEVDIIGAKWLGNFKDESKDIICDATGALIFAMIPPKDVYSLVRSEQITTIKDKFKSSYIYLRKVNSIHNLIILREEGKYWNTWKIFPNLNEKNKIYNNGAIIYE